MPLRLTLAILCLLGPLVSSLSAHQGSHPTGLDPCDDAVPALVGFQLFGNGVTGSRNQDPFEPQHYRLVNLAAPGELPSAEARISLVLGLGHQSSYSDYTIRVVLPTGVHEFNGSDFPYVWPISPIIHGWSGTMRVFATNNACDFTLMATADWDLPRPGGPPDPCAPCSDLTCQSLARIGSVKLSLPLGVVQHGVEAVSLLYESETLTNLGAAHLELSAPLGEQGPLVQKDPNQVLSSVRCGPHLTRITTEPSLDDPLRFVVRVSSDPESPDTSVFRETSVENLTLPGAVPALRLTETLQGRTTTRLYTQPAPGTWILEEAGMRRTTKTILSTTATTRVIRWRVEEKDAAGTWTNVELREDHETNYQWGWTLTKRILDPDRQAVTSTWDYYDFGESSGPYNDRYGHGRLKSETLPTGMVRSFQYLDADPFHSGYTHVEITREAYAHEALALERRRHLSATASTLSELHETWLDGHLVGKTEIVARSGGGSHWREEKHYPDGIATPLVTRVEFDQWASNPLLQKTIYPDRSIEQIDVDTTGELKTVTTWRGVANPRGGVPITTGQQDVTVFNQIGQIAYRELCEIRESVAFPLEIALATETDPLGRPTTTEIFHSGSTTPTFTETRQFGCCGLATRTGQDGLPVHYYYDHLARLTKVHRNGLATETIYDGLTTHTHLYPEATPSALSFATAANEASFATRNLVGDLVAEATRAPHDGSLVSTTYATTYHPEPGIGRRVVQTLPLTPDDHGIAPTITADFYLDGRPRQRTGTPVIDRLLTYGVNSAGLTVTSAILDGNSTPRQARTTQLDWMGRALRITYAGDADHDGQPDQSHSAYDSAGRLAREVDPDGVTTLYAYDLPTETVTRALDLNRNGTIEPELDEVYLVRRGVNADPAGHTTTWTETLVRDTDHSGAGVERLLSRQETRADLLESRSHLYADGAPSTTHQLTTFLPGQPGTWNATITNPDGTTVHRAFRSGLLTTESLTAADLTPLVSRRFSYDSHQRLTTVTDTSGPTITRSYLAPLLEVPASITTGDRTTHFAYDPRGRRVLVDEPDTLDPDGQIVANQQVISYEPHDALREITGTPGYRRRFTYDFAQRLATLTTYGATPTTTRWEYDPDRGFLLTKRHDSPAPGLGTGQSYSFTAAGRLAQRLNARGTTATYAHGPDGRLTSLTYSDSTPSLVIEARDRLGRVTRLTDATGPRALSYHDQGTLATTSYLDGSLLAGWSVDQARDSQGRLTALGVTNSATTPLLVTYAYDQAGRPTSVEGSQLKAHYHYDSALQRVDQLSFVDSSRLLQVTSRHYDHLNRLARITSHNGNLQGQFLVHSDYLTQRDRFGRITQTTLRDGTQWRYAYQPSGELATAARHLTGTSPARLAAHSFAWTYDGIGNRLSSSRGGDHAGTALRTSSYSPNALNQLTARQSPPFVDVTGTAPPTPEVLVNGQAAARQGPFFRSELSADTSAGPVSQPVTVTQGPNQYSGTLLLPPAQASFQYDPDGNLSSDGTFHYQWDAENRLTRLETLPATVAAGVPYQRVEYTYDSQSRRLQRLLYDQPPPATPTQTTSYLYAGWRCLGELDHTGTLQRSYAWGLDNHDALHLGDGNGALLWIHDHTSSETHLTSYDRNGNLTGLLSTRTRQPTATYSYSPFGELLAATGPYADANPFRFSTKPLEPVANLYDYGYRHYHPAHGAWLSRDPINEAGGLNLYGFVENDPVNRHDKLGLDSFSDNGQRSRFLSFLGDFFDVATEESAEAGRLGGAVERQMLSQGTNSITAKLNGLLAFGGDVTGLLNFVELSPWEINGKFTTGPDGQLQMEKFGDLWDQLGHVAEGGLKTLATAAGGKGLKRARCECSPRRTLQAPIPLSALDPLRKRLDRLGYTPTARDPILDTVLRGDPVIVLGENMNRVRAVARMVSQAGGNVRTYNPRNFTGLTRRDLEANRSWMRYWVKSRGAAAIDIGRQPVRRPSGPSLFYWMENNSLNRWGICTPFNYGTRPNIPRP